MTSDPETPLSWRATLQLYLSAPVRPLLFLGFSSGLPFLLVFSTLSAWLTQAGVKRATIGYLSWAGLAYSLKFFWSPMVDRLPIPILHRLGRRRSWMLLSQIALIVTLTLLAHSNPAMNINQVALLAVCVAFASATQDIAIDAYRIERGEAAQQGVMAAAYQLGYRLALIAAGAGALFLAADYGWRWTYLSMAALVTIGIITTLMIEDSATTLDRAALANEPEVQRFLAASHGWPIHARNVIAWLIGAVLCPFFDFVSRLGWRLTALTLAFIASYRASDYLMGVMANNFYLSIGFSLQDIAWVTKIFGVIMNLCGVFIGALLTARLGAMRTALFGLVAVAIANLCFAWLAAHPQAGLPGLIAVITVDNTSIGVEGTAFTVYLSQLTNQRYTATQYALLGMAWSLPCKTLAGTSGLVVDAIGFPSFFVYTAAMSLPALLLGLWMLRMQGPTLSGKQG